jgi:hypothetical protein
MKNDDLNRELRGLDPVKPDELVGSAETADAGELLQRILAVDPEPTAPTPLPEEPRRLRVPKLALAAVAVAAVAILVVLISLPGGDGGSDRLADALDGAAVAAASQSPPGVGRPYTYLKTREVSVNTTAADQRSWKVVQSTTREEWVTRDAAGRLRVVVGPSRFVDSGDRAEWEGAGRPTFLTLGFGGRTEERWLAAGTLRGGIDELPTDPAALARRLRAEASLAHGELPVAATTLGLIAEDLRNPGASPELRQALYRAAKRVPGIHYLGEVTDPADRPGIAVGVTSSHSGSPILYSLIFDPRTSEALATETTALDPTGPGAPAGRTLQRATVYLDSRGIETPAGLSPSEFEPSTSADEPGMSSLVYRIPGNGDPE